MIFDNAIITYFLEFYNNKWYKLNTIEQFRADINQFRQFCLYNNANNIEDITVKLIYEYTEVLRNTQINIRSRYHDRGGNLSKSTISRKIKNIKNLMRFCNMVYDIWIHHERIELPRAPRVKMEYLSVNEVEDLVRHIEEGEETQETKFRNILLVKLGFVTWMRLSELLSIRVEEILKPGYKIESLWNFSQIFYRNWKENTLPHAQAFICY